MSCADEETDGFYFGKSITIIHTMKSKKVLIIGGLGNGSIVANAILHANRLGYMEWVCEGFLNDHTPIGENIDIFPVVGTLKQVGEFLARAIISLIRSYALMDNGNAWIFLSLCKSRMTAWPLLFTHLRMWLQMSSLVLER